MVTVVLRVTNRWSITASNRDFSGFGREISSPGLSAIDKGGSMVIAGGEGSYHYK